ncbi:MAG: ATPase [Lachnospiraceae bacterium]|nr:ATPase [Lachnospiraceae bacterium]
MSSKRIEQAIEEIYEFIEMCKPKGLSSTNIVVRKEELLDMLDELKLKIPDEVSRCSKILDRREEILREAELKAQKIIDDAALKAEALVHDSEIMRQAYLQANEFIARANQQADETISAANYEAEQIRSGAYEYTKDMLLQIENVLSTSLEDTKAKQDALVEALSRNLEIVTANRKELCEEVAPEPRPESDIVSDIENETEGQYENDGQFFGNNENEEADNFTVDSEAFMRDID